jgi:hypothetical protein
VDRGQSIRNAAVARATARWAAVIDDMVFNDLCTPHSMTNTTATTSPTGPLTLEAIQRAAKLLVELPPEPFREFMVRKGCPPDQGWVLLLPSTVRDEMTLPSILPAYVRFSPVVQGPVFMNGPMANKLTEQPPLARRGWMGDRSGTPFGPTDN